MFVDLSRPGIRASVKELYDRARKVTARRSDFCFSVCRSGADQGATEAIFPSGVGSKRPQPTAAVQNLAFHFDFGCGGVRLFRIAAAFEKVGYFQAEVAGISGVGER